MRVCSELFETFALFQTKTAQKPCRFVPPPHATAPMLQLCKCCMWIKMHPFKLIYWSGMFIYQWAKARGLCYAWLFFIISSACKNGQPQKGQLWPPFLPLKPLPEKFCALTKILHSKTLHGVFFFIFHKVTKAACQVTICNYWIGGAELVQWWERSPSTNVAWVRFPDPASYVGWVCCWFSCLLREVFLRVLLIWQIL